MVYLHSPRFKKVTTLLLIFGCAIIYTKVVFAGTESSLIATIEKKLEQQHDLDLINAIEQIPTVKIEEQKPEPINVQKQEFHLPSHSSTVPLAYSTAYNKLAEQQNVKSGSDADSHTTSFPHMIHMIWLGSPFPDKGNKCLDEWKHSHPEWEVIIWDNIAIDYMIQQHFVQYEEMYKKLPLPVMQSDVSRLMILHVFGGIYADIDACPIKPFSDWKLVPPSATLVVGVEIDTLRSDWRTFAGRPFQIATWTLVSVPRHPVWPMIINESAQRMRSLIDSPNHNWQMNKTSEVLEKTGPSVVTDVILHQYMSQFGNTSHAELHGMDKPRIFGDAVLLPISSFAVHNREMGGKGDLHSDAYINHMFFGSWKS